MDCLVRWAGRSRLFWSNSTAFVRIPVGTGLVHIPVARSWLESAQASCVEIYQSLLPNYEILWLVRLRRRKVNYIYFALRIAIRHFNCPGGRPIATIQDIPKLLYRRKYEFLIKDEMKYLVLVCKSIDLFLAAIEHRSSSIGYWHNSCLPHPPAPYE